MKRIPILSLLLLSVSLSLSVLVCPLQSLAQTPAQNRVTQAINNGDLAVLKGNRPGFARAEFDRGPVEGAMRLTGVSLNFRPSQAQQAEIDQLLEQQQTPGSPSYHKWITPDQYAARFGMSASDLNKITAWLQAQGFTGITVSRSHNRISFNGTAARVEAALHTGLHYYQVNGEKHFAMSDAPSLPRAFAATVLSIRHLDDFRPRPRVRTEQRSALAVNPSFTSSSTGNHYLSPGDFATIYDLQPLYDSGIDGSGVTIAVVGQTTIRQADVTAFRSAAQLPAPLLTMQQVNGSGTATECTDDEVEADLDVEWSGAVAPGAHVLYLFTGLNSGTTCANPGQSDNVWDALFEAINDNLAPVISTSYGFCEPGLGTAAVQQIEGWAVQANLQGQTISASSGDDGAADCDTGNSATQGYAVDAPASIPEVTGVGGSEFNGDTASTSDTTFWLGASGGTDTLDSAKSYILEKAWNDSTASIAAGKGFSASGGGASVVFAKPSWQTGTGVPAANHRFVPDISFSASANHDGYLICSQAAATPDTSCSSGFRTANGNLTVVGGTSVGSQVFGGVLAIINEGGGIGGNVNPTLYSLKASNASAFHDIMSGDNIVPCTAPSTDCPNGTTTIGFTAGTGYDEVTGLGSLDLNTLINVWPGFDITPTPGFSMSGSGITIAAAGGAGTSNITVTPSNGFTGTVDLSCALSPASTTAEVTCSIPASVDLTSGTTTATLTVNTTAAHAISGTSATARPHGRFPWLPASGALGFAGIVLLSVPARRRKTAALAMVMFAALAVWMGCGGGSSSSNNNNTTDPGTPTGSYTIVVTGTSGSTTHTTNITVTVQ